MELFNSGSFRILRLAARFRPMAEPNQRTAGSAEIASVIGQLMNEGFYSEEFAHLDNPGLSPFQTTPVMEKFLRHLGWHPLSDEEEFRFLTALYASIGIKDDITAYHAICRWMEDVGRELNKKYTVVYLGDVIGAERIYGCYYSYSNVTGTDLIPSVKDPLAHDWDSEGFARPKTVFAEWLASHPNDLTHFRPFNEEILKSLTV